MPRKLSDRQKMEQGTFRPDREPSPKTPAEAQADVTTAAVALEQAKKHAKRNLTARQKKLAKDKVRVLTDLLEIALEASAKALKVAAKAPAPLRPGLGQMSYEDCMNAQPPLTWDEELEWLALEAGIPPVSI
jgi:hypothetical protein